MRGFIRIHHVLMGDMAAVKVLKNALCLKMGYFVAMETYVMLLLYKSYDTNCVFYVFGDIDLITQSMHALLECSCEVS